MEPQYHQLGLASWSEHHYNHEFSTCAAGFIFTCLLVEHDNTARSTTPFLVSIRTPLPPQSTPCSEPAIISTRRCTFQNLKLDAGRLQISDASFNVRYMYNTTLYNILDFRHTTLSSYYYITLRAFMFVIYPEISRDISRNTPVFLAGISLLWSWTPGLLLEPNYRDD